VTNKPKFFPLDPFEIAQNHLDFPISSVQPHYFVAESFLSAKDIITKYCDQMSKPFNVSYDEKSGQVFVDRAIKTREELTGGLEF
jgi:phenylalanine-4-hydroxylase